MVYSRIIINNWFDVFQVPSLSGNLCELRIMLVNAWAWAVKEHDLHVHTNIIFVVLIKHLEAMNHHFFLPFSKF